MRNPFLKQAFGLAVGLSVFGIEAQFKPASALTVSFPGRLSAAGYTLHAKSKRQRIFI
jgi:hypothetical protein